MITFTSSSGLLTNEGGTRANAIEGDTFSFQHAVTEMHEVGETEEPVVLRFVVSEGEVPHNIVLDPETGLQAGTATEMNLYVEEYMTTEKINKDGSNYGKYGSAADGYRDFNFVVKCYNENDEAYSAEQQCTIRVINNYSSDRDNLLIEWANVWADDPDNAFYIDGESVDARTYIKYRKDNGDFPSL